MMKKRFLSALLAILVIVTTIPLVALPASAAAPTNYTTVTSGSSTYVSLSSGSKYYRFVPTVSGTYEFYSSNNSGDTYGYLLDANGNTLRSDDDGGDGLNFKITYDCTAGSVYYVQARMYSSGSGNYYLNVRLVQAQQPAGDVVNVNAANGTSYSLFNSGATNAGYGSQIVPNPAPATHNNNGHDLGGNITPAAEARFRLGQSFLVNTTINEQARLNIYAYDVDENIKDCGSGYEYDYIYLIDETDGSSTRLDGHMSGQNDTWNNSTFTVDPALLENGHTYHFELQMTCTGNHSCSYYSVIVRTVALIVNGTGETPPPATGIENADLSASISASGLVSVDLTANAYASATYTLEYKAVCAADEAQYGGKEYSVTIPATSSEFSTTFQLESCAPRGTYELTVFIKDGGRNVVATRTVTASYGYSAVSYNSNGGSQNLPTDGTTYSSGDTVTVLFNYLPSRSGYTFLGWARNSAATEPEFTANGTKTFTIGATDVTLYAVWQEEIPETPPTDPDADEWDGTASNGFGGGTGTQSNPYLIYTAEQLAYLARSVNGGNTYSGKYFKLMNNLDLNNLEWTPIGYSDFDNSDGNHFNGYFDGNYKIVYNLKITGNRECSGLFGSIYSATLTRLGVVDANIGVYFDEDPIMAGAICGRALSSTISYCYASGTVYAKSSKSVPSHCVAAGMILGCNKSNVTISNCFATGVVEGEMLRAWNSYVGGLTGVDNGSINITNSYFSGEVIAKAYKESYAAGIIGRGGSVSNSFAAGTVTAYNGTTKIADGISNNISTNSYYSADVYKGATKVSSTYGLVTSDSNFKSQSWLTSTLGWDFSDVWMFDADVSEYPILRGFYYGAGAGCDHVEGSWIIDQEATCTTAGSKHTECTLCGATMNTEEIPMLDHVYGEWVNDSDEHWHECACGDKTDVASHVYDNANDTDCNECGYVRTVFSGDADLWDGTASNGFGGGTGTQNDPYLIYTAEQLAYLAQSTNAGNTYTGTYFKLMNDIDLNNIEWTPIGKGVLTSSEDTQRGFSGRFDGNYHIIFNLTVNNATTSYSGLFGVATGEIKNIGLINTDISTNVSQRAYAGNIVGYLYSGTISNSFVTNGKIVSLSSSAACMSGGISGGTGINATIRDCFVTGYVGGNGYTGGIVGAMLGLGSGSSTVDNTYFDGILENTGNRGGSYIPCEIGGIGNPMFSSSTAIRDSFFVGSMSSVISGIYMGGVSGDDRGPIYNSYYSSISSGSFNRSNGTSTVASNFKSQSWLTSTLGWDFSNVWTFNADVSEYPVLRGFNYNGGEIVEPPVHTHVEGPWIVDDEATCTTAGSKHTECTECGETINTGYIPALGHNRVSTVVRQATCTTPGIIRHTCLRCGDSYDTYVHVTHNWEHTSHTDATCTADGADVYTCSLCGDENVVPVIGGHDYHAVIEIVATATQDGLVRYTCSKCGDEYTETIPARPDATVLLVQDRFPWSENNNVSLLTKMKNDGYITDWNMTTTAGFASVDLTQYSVILIANDQTTATYSQLALLSESLDNFANAGGVVIYGACDNGWAGGDIYHSLPEGVTKNNYYSRHNYIVDNDHPIVTGVMTDGKSLTNQLLYGNYCSHTYFNGSTLPENANVILQDANGNATLVEYSVGNGHVILSGLTWEFYYVRGAYDSRLNTTYTKNVYDDLVVYAISLANPCDHAYDEGTVVDPTCTEDGYTLHTCSKCGATIKENIISAPGHTEGEWVTVTEPTTEVAGLKQKTCTVCGEVLASEVIPMLNQAIIEVQSPDTVIIGQEITFSIVISDCDPIKFMSLVPIFDTDIFELVSASWEIVAPNQSITDGTLYSVSEWNELTDVNTVVYTITLRAKELTNTTQVDCTVELQDNNGMVLLSVVAKTVSVIECTHASVTYSSIDSEYHACICDICGHTEVAAHEYGEDWSADADEHWHECAICGGRNDVAAHEYDNACDTDCNECGDTRVTTHSFGDWTEYNANQHIRYCDCGAEETADHEYYHANDTDCNECGYVRTIASNDADLWDGTASSGFGGGTGTQNDPYLIYTAEQLAYLAQSTNAGNTYSGKYFKLMNNLDLNDLEWTPIGKGILTGNTSTDIQGRFSGHFDGNYKIIYNLKIEANNTTYTGLFGDVENGSIKNLGIQNATIDASVGSGMRSKTGALVGRIVSTTIENCFVLNADIANHTVDYPGGTGCLVGNAFGGTVTNCFVQGDVVGNGHVAILFGSVYSTVTITNCYAIGSSRTDGTAGGTVIVAGGIIGYVGSGASIRNCFAIGSVTSGDKKGAISGSTGTITNCYHNVTGFSGATSLDNFRSQAWITTTLGWNFSSIWTFDSDVSEYPVLQGFGYGGEPSGCDHVEGSWIIDAEPTCTEKGSQHTECTLCGAVINTEEIPELGHEYGEDWESNTDEHWHECACGDKTDVASHVYDDADDATCNECGHRRAVSSGDTDVWDGTVANGFGGGTGTQNDPYLIYTAEQLAYLARSVNGGNTYSGKYFKLMKNLDLNYLEWTPIGYSDMNMSSRLFKGHFDGNCLVVKNVKISRFQGFAGGLFGAIDDASLRNLGVESIDYTITSGGRSGGLCGMMRNSTIENCYVTGNIVHTSSTSFSGGYGIGGLIGDMRGGATVRNCYTDCVLSNFKNSVDVFVGGLVGHVCSDGSKSIINCYTTSTIIKNGINIYDVGGLVGELWHGNLVIENCFSLATIDNHYTNMLVGSKSATLTVRNSYYPTGGTSSYGGTATAADNFKSQSWLASTLGWNFSSIWTFDSDVSEYPVLQGFGYGGETPKCDHVEGSWIIDTEPTCTAVGVKHTQCTLCGETMRIEEIPTLDHEYMADWESNVEGHWHECECGEKTDVEAHEYDNECDADCNVCGYERVTEHQHGEWFNDCDDHWKECTECGDIVQKAAHEYDNSCDATCNVCGYIRVGATITLNVGEYTNIKSGAITFVYNSDVFEIIEARWSISGIVLDQFNSENGIGAFGFSTTGTVSGDILVLTVRAKTSNQLAITSALMTLSAQLDLLDGGNDAINVTLGRQNITVERIYCHVYDNACDAECNACGYMRDADHSYGADWVSDGYEHWHECEVCGDKTDVESHAYDYDCDTDCNECGAVRAAAHGYGDWNEYNADEHVRFCECGAAEYAAHNWNSGVITVEPTKESEGIKTFTCTECGATNDIVLPPILDGSMLIIDNAVGIAGGFINVTVRLEGNPGIWSMAFELPIDTNIFEFVSADVSGSVFSQFGVCGYDETTNSYKFNGNSGSITDNLIADGTVVVITLKIKDNVELGEYDLIPVLSERDTVDVEENIINFECVGGKITVTDYNILGDVNRDGYVTNADVLMIYRYIYNENLYPLDEQLADVNHDGYVTNADVLKIYRYIYNSTLYPIN